MDINPGYAVATAVALVGLGIHVFIGGKSMVRPLLASRLPEPAKWLLYLCFHMVSLLCLTMIVVFSWAAQSFLGRPAAMVLTAVAFAAMLLAAFVGIRGRLKLRFNAPLFLFALIFVAGFWGSYGSFFDLLTG
jgi:hypothetical protein